MITLKVDEIANHMGTKKIEILKDYIPIALGANDIYLMIGSKKSSPDNEKVFTYDLDTKKLDKISDSLGLYLEALRDKMLMKKVEYDDINGLISIK